MGCVDEQLNYEAAEAVSQSALGECYRMLGCFAMCKVQMYASLAFYCNQASAKPSALMYQDAEYHS